MKTSRSLCSSDQIPIIFYKLPYQRSYLTAIIAEIWKKKVIPPTLKKAITILIYKKGSTDNPGNFCAITMETVTLKILTSALRNKICQFLSSNNYIENNIQKGFVNRISGTYENATHAHTTYFTVGIKNGATLNFSISNWRLWCIVILYGQYGYSASYREL